MNATSTVAGVNAVLALVLSGFVEAGSLEQQQQLEGHIVWSVAHEGCPAYGKTQDSVRADSLLPANELRQCFLAVQQRNPDAYKLIAKARDPAIVESTTEAIKDAKTQYKVRENFEWVLQHEGQVTYFKALAADNNFTAIRSKYKQLQAHNPDAQNALSLLTDSELSAQINRERVSVFVSPAVTAGDLAKIAQFTQPTTLTLAQPTDLSDLSRKVYGTSAVPYLELLKSNNAPLIVQSSLAPGTVNIPSVPPPGVAQAFLPRDGLSADLASTRINASNASALNPGAARSEIAHGGQIEQPVHGASLQSTTKQAFPDAGARWYIQAVGADHIMRGDLDFNARAVAAVIGIIDAGVDQTHPALRPVLWRLPAELATTRWPADSIGYDFYNEDPNPVEEIDNSHGTHVTGLSTGRQLAAWLPVLDDAGLSTNVAVYSLKVAGANGKFDFTAAQNAIGAGIRNNVHIFNLSLSGPYSEMLQDYLLLEEHLNSTLLVIAAGNQTQDMDADSSIHETFRNKDGSAMRNVIFVGALADDGKLADFSNFGKTIVEIAAPGIEISSTIHQASFGPLSGTSQAAPFVTLAAAILKAENPEMVPAGLKNRILNTCDMDDALKEQVARGCRLNLLKAVVTGSDLAELKNGDLMRGDIDRKQFFTEQAADASLVRISTPAASTATYIFVNGKHESRPLPTRSIAIKLHTESKCPRALANGMCILDPAEVMDMVFRVR
jgi:subtilisin family serine protease